MSNAKNTAPAVPVTLQQLMTAEKINVSEKNARRILRAKFASRASHEKGNRWTFVTGSKLYNDVRDALRTRTARPTATTD